MLGTPTDDVWQDVTKMPEHSVEFPKYIVNGNENLRKNLKYFSDDEDYIDLMTQMLQLEPSKRISVKGALKHPFFNYYHEKSR
jgi:serine/threonine protein kinase